MIHLGTQQAKIDLNICFCQIIPARDPISVALTQATFIVSCPRQVTLEGPLEKQTFAALSFLCLITNINRS